MIHSPRTRRTIRHRGLTVVEVVLVGVTIAILLAIALPVLAAAAGANETKASLSNLRTLGVAHLMYAADWNGRQLSHTVDDLAEYGSSAQQAFPGYNFANGVYPPAHVLGWGFLPSNPDTPVLFQYSNVWTGNWPLSQPITFDGFADGLGAFRIPNSRPFHDYLNGRFYDPVFYAPADTAAYDLAAPVFDDPQEFVYVSTGSPLGDVPVWASYCMSPAAQFDPLVFSPGGEVGAYTNPFTIDTGFTAPSFFAARHPELKTFMLEHYWNQNRPDEFCNPAFEDGGSFNGCEPYFYNHGLASAPATLFFDLSTRLLPNTEVKSADDTVFKADGIGLWSRDTPFGSTGYFGEFALDDILLSHHILTVEGILGRDRVASPPPLPVTVR